MFEKRDEAMGEVKGLRREFKDYRKEFEDYRQESRGFAGETNKNFKTLEGVWGGISQADPGPRDAREGVLGDWELTRAVDTLSNLVRKFLGKQD